MTVDKRQNDDAADLPEKSVLFVDDVPEILHVLTAVAARVRPANLRVFAERDGARALDLVRSRPFDLVVSDFRMREVDGIEVLQAARRANPGGYRVLITGYNEIPTSIHRICDAGVDAYFQKPIHAQQLLLVLHDFLRVNAAAIAAWRAQARHLESLALLEEAERKPPAGAEAPPASGGATFAR